MQINIIINAEHLVLVIHVRITIHVLCFKFIFGLTFFKPVWFLFSFVFKYDNEYETKENNNQAVVGSNWTDPWPKSYKDK